MKELGFNMLRKHIKLESSRWYYYCDRLGMLVWQDLVNGGSACHALYCTYLPTIFPSRQRRIRDDAKHYKKLSREDAQGRLEFEAEMKETVRRLKPFGSIAVWTLFNEGWGQFDAARLTEEFKKLDPERLLDQASGWFDQKGGDFYSIHNYFRKLKLKEGKPDPGERIIALTEYGGHTYAVEGHTQSQNTYGYKDHKTGEELNAAYEELLNRDVFSNIENGLSAVIYTQLSDIEGEINGICTYDRRVIKFDEQRLKKLHAQLQLKFAQATEKQNRQDSKAIQEATSEAPKAAPKEAPSETPQEATSEAPQEVTSETPQETTTGTTSETASGTTV